MWRRSLVFGYPEDGGDMFLRNVVSCLQGYTASQLSKRQSTTKPFNLQAAVNQKLLKLTVCELQCPQS
jgi:hypothetical protein